jgi:hypothetical protein
MIKLKGFEFKTNINEFTIEEYEKITRIIERAQENYIQKWLDVFSILCDDDDIISSLTEEDLFEFIAKLDEINLPSSEMKKSIKIGDREWIAYQGDEFKLKLKDLSIIETFFKDKQDFFAKILAVIFKDPLLDNNLDLDVIHEREMLFRNLIAGDYLIYVTTIVEKIIKKVETIDASAA